MTDNIIACKSFDFARQTILTLKGINLSHFDRIIVSQLVRSATSVGAMVREAQHAESKKDFIHKFSISQKELNESVYWIELILSCKSENQLEKLSLLLNQATELQKIISSIILTSKGLDKRNKNL